IWMILNRSPLCSPQRTIVACTAPNKSSAPVPADRDAYATEKPAAYTKSATAEIQLPSRSDKCRGTASVLSELLINGEAVRSTITPLRMVMMSQSARAPEKRRMNVKDAGSMLLSFSAARQSKELLAKAIIANSVHMKILDDFIIGGIQSQSIG